MAAVSMAHAKVKSPGSKLRRISQEQARAAALVKAPSNVSESSSRFDQNRTISMVLADNEGDDDQQKTHFVIDSRWFAMVVNILIMLNAIEIGLSSDLRGDKWTWIWKATGIFFAGSFTVEMLLKLAVLRHKYFWENWNVIDMCIVMVSLFEIVVLNFILNDTGQMGSMTILRIFRLFKLIRLVRMFKVFQELIVLLDAMLKSLRTLFWVMLLLLLAIYMFAIVCVEIIGHSESYPSYSEEVGDLDAIAMEFNNFQFFGTITRSMLSLFSLITLSEWSDITRPVSEIQPYMVPPILVFGMLTAFGVMNVVIGVMVEHALDAAREFVSKQEEDTRIKQMAAVCQVGKLLVDVDTEQRGSIKLGEMEGALNSSKRFQELLDSVDLPIHVTVEELFLLMDDSGDAMVHPEEFELAMHRLIFSTEFQRMCLMQMSLNKVKHMIHELMTLLKTVPHASSDAENDHPECKLLNSRTRGNYDQTRCGNCPPSLFASQTLDLMLNDESFHSTQTVSKEPELSTSTMAGNQTPSSSRLLQAMRELREETRIMKFDFQTRFDEMANHLRELQPRRLHLHKSEFDEGESFSAVQTCRLDDGCAKQHRCHGGMKADVACIDMDLVDNFTVSTASKGHLWATKEDVGAVPMQVTVALPPEATPPAL